MSPSPLQGFHSWRIPPQCVEFSTIAKTVENCGDFHANLKSCGDFHNYFEICGDLDANVTTSWVKFSPLNKLSPLFDRFSIQNNAKIVFSESVPNGIWLWVTTLPPSPLLSGYRPLASNKLAASTIAVSLPQLGWNYIVNAASAISMSVSLKCFW